MLLTDVCYFYVLSRLFILYDVFMSFSHDLPKAPCYSSLLYHHVFLMARLGSDLELGCHIYLGWGKALTMDSGSEAVFVVVSPKQFLVGCVGFVCLTCCIIQVINISKRSFS